MQTNPVRVLNVLGTTNLGGAESRVMELYRALDKTKVQFDFLVHTDQEDSTIRKSAVWAAAYTACRAFGD